GEDRRPGRVQLAHELVQRDPALRVETGGRLVEEQHRRSVHDRAGDHQPLRHAARERIDGTAPDVGERDLLEQGVGLAGGVGGADAEEAPVEDEVLAHAEAAVEGVVLGEDADERARHGGPRAAPATPPQPAVRSPRVVSMPAVVDLPAPFGPSRPRISPRRTTRSRPSTAVTPPGYTFVRPSARTASWLGARVVITLD